MKQERVHIICPACRQQVEAVAIGGQVKGYCAVAKQYVDFRIEAKRPIETPGRAGARDSKGRFAKGSVPWNKKKQP
jgi:hypothetical protein